MHAARSPKSSSTPARHSLLSVACPVDRLAGRLTRVAGHFRSLPATPQLDRPGLDWALSSRSAFRSSSGPCGNAVLLTGPGNRWREGYIYPQVSLAPGGAQMHNHWLLEVQLLASLALALTRCSAAALRPLLGRVAMQGTHHMDQQKLTPSPTPPLRHIF